MKKLLLALLACLSLAAADPLESLHWTLSPSAQNGDFARAASECESRGDRLGEAYCLGRLGDRASLERALRILPDDAPVGGRVALERMLGELTGDAALLRQAASRMGPELETARCLKALGNLEADAGHLDAARRLYLQAQTLAGEDAELQQRLLLNLGILDMQAGDYRGALRQLDQVTLPQLQGAVQANRATALSHLGQDVEAEQAFLAALEQLPEGQRSIGWQNLAGLYLRQKRWPEAERALDEAERARPGDPGLRLLRGNLLVDQGRLLEGRELLQRSLEDFRARGNELGVGVALSGLGQAATYLGDLEAADRALTESEAILTRLGRPAELAVVFEQRGEYWQQIGNDGLARDSYYKALTDFALLGMTEEQKRVEGNLARLALLSAQGELALEKLEQNAPGPAAGPARQSLYLQAVAGAKILSGRLAEGRADLARALQLAEGLEDQQNAVLHDMAAVELAVGELEAAREHFEQVLAYYRGHAMVGAAAFARRSLAEVLSRLGRKAEALEQGRLALEEMLELRTRVLYAAGFENQMLLGELQQSLPRLVAGLALEQDDAEGALAALETSRGFTESAWRRAIFRAADDPEAQAMLRQGQELAARVQQLGDTPEAAGLKARMNNLELEFWRRKGRQDQSVLPTAAGIRERLPARTAYLEYARLKDGWHVFAVTPDGLRTARLGELPDVAALRRAWARNESSDEASLAMRRALLGPVEPSLAGLDRLLIVADDELQDLPFEALRSEQGRYLVQDYAIAYLNSARELWEPPPAKQGTGAVVLGGAEYASTSTWKPLPGSLEEADAVQKLLGGGTLLTGKGATEQAVMARAPGHKVLHLATHGFAERPTPLRHDGGMFSAYANFTLVLQYLTHQTGVVCAGEDTLHPMEVLGMDLRGTDLVVLSACQTALGPKENDEGVMGLRRAFRFAGARSLLVTMWKVDDEATRALMERFYRHYEAGETADVALRQAQIELLEGGPKFAAPYYWAAFVAVGFSAPSSATP